MDPRCYVRHESQLSTTLSRKLNAARLEKGQSFNVDTRPIVNSSTSLSPYRQSSVDVPLPLSTPFPSAPYQQQQPQQEAYFTPRGSSLSVMGSQSTNTPTGSQHLSPPSTSSATAVNVSRQARGLEKKHLTAQIEFAGKRRARSDDRALIHSNRWTSCCSFLGHLWRT